MCSENPKVRDSRTIVLICVGSQGLSFCTMSTIQARSDPPKPPNLHRAGPQCEYLIFDQPRRWYQSYYNLIYFSMEGSLYKLAMANCLSLAIPHLPSKAPHCPIVFCFLFFRISLGSWLPEILTTYDPGVSFLAGPEAAPGDLWGVQSLICSEG